jgi:hypothetical protein
MKDSKRARGKVAEKELRTVVNMNYPKGVSTEELERFWGEPTPEDTRWAESLRNRVAKIKCKPSVL